MRERKKNRLEEYDYSNPGVYFVTLCVQNRESVFGTITDGEIKLNEFGKIVTEQWMWLFKQYNYIQIDEYVVMPNHVHGIVRIVEDDNCCVGNGRDRSLRIKPLPQIIGAYKTTSCKLIHQSGQLEFKWQKSYYDRIVRNEDELNRVREYIRNNPLCWESDHENSTNNTL